MNIQQLRAETTGCGLVNHLNNAGSGLMPDVVRRAVLEHKQLEVDLGGYEAAALRATAIEEMHVLAGRLFNCAASNIAFTSSATDSFTRALSSIPFSAGDVILTDNDDFISNQIQFLALQRRFGVRLVRVASDTWYILDACQSAGQMNLDVQALRCDFMSVTTRKFLWGPRGTGLLYVSDRALDAGLEPLFIDMRGATLTDKDRYEARPGAIRFEDWELAYALLLGTSEALRYCLDIGTDWIWSRVQYLATMLREGLSAIPGVRVLDRASYWGRWLRLRLLVLARKYWWGNY